MSAMGGGERPQNVGILAADVYFPSTFVTQVCTGCKKRVLALQRQQKQQRYHRVYEI